MTLVLAYDIVKYSNQRLIGLRDTEVNMSNVIEMPGGLHDLDKIFEISEFLENKKELITQFKPEVSKFLVKKDFFTGPFRMTYNKAFDELIAKLIKTEITNHFPSYDPEEILLLTDISFLKLIAEDMFVQDNYKDSKEESKKLN